MSLPTIENRPMMDQGLNQCAVFNISELPDAIINNLNEHVEQLGQYTQLILFAHSGRKFWDKLQNSGFKSSNPIDDFTLKKVNQFFVDTLPDCKYSIVYPSPYPLNLQKLGELAGWHHSSPFRIGINNLWGTWFAYRAVILTNTKLKTTQKHLTKSPCEQCIDKPCIQSCATTALDTGKLELNQCIEYRKKSDSTCKETCHARTSCPIGEDARYSTEQIEYHYRISMKYIDSVSDIS